VRLEELEHVIRAAADVCGEPEIIVIGSQAILASRSEVPREMVVSLEADVYPRNAPDRAIEIEGAIGDGSPFHRQFGYFAHAVGPETAKAPQGWKGRLVAMEVAARAGTEKRLIAYCMEPNDLVLAKCAAGRERDWEFARLAIDAGLADPAILSSRISDLPVAADHRRYIEKMIKGVVAELDRSKSGP
jgi:hypothetical protein